MSTDVQQPVKAYLVIETRNKPLNCWFNPTTLALRRGADWKKTNTVAGKVQKPDYRGGGGDAITLNLLLHAEDNRKGPQVQGNINELLKLADATVDTGGEVPQKRPPTVTLHWGKFVSCTCVATSVDVTVELFDVDGTPLRATVNIALTQFEPQAGQAASKWTNPTTRASLRRRLHNLRPGENVHLVANEHLRDPAKWRVIAEFNELDDPLRVRSGDTLVVPMDGA
jgi:Contractile injection system tube protein